MRLVFVNHCHPDTPHICGTRAARFAESCASRGHEVVLLTETLEGQYPNVRPESLVAAFAAHDWSRPFHLTCSPVGHPLLRALREGRLRGGAGKAVAAAYYLARSGVFVDWRDGSYPYWPVLARVFRPQATWGVFGNTDALVIARGIARMAGCPWVMDVKDPWGVFIPGPIRGLIGHRFGDAAAVTALSRAHAADLASWFKRPSTVIYSGIGSEMLTPMPPPRATSRRLLLLGGLYRQSELETLISGVAAWRQSLSPDNEDVEVTYAGGEGQRLAETADRLAPGLKVVCPGYLTLAQIRLLAAESRACLYVRSHSALFQHKLFELTAMSRPIIGLPPEGDEARALVRSVGGCLWECADAAQVVDALTRAPYSCPPDLDKLSEFGWDAQADRLLGLFRELVP